MKIPSSILLLAATAGSCATTPRPEPLPLPFHVGVAPLTEVRTTPDSSEGAMAFRLSPDTVEELPARLTAALNGTAFTRATALDAAPLRDRLDPLGSQLLRAREQSSVDLLMTLELWHTEVIHSDISEQRSNWIPWWLPGPWFWWLPDLAYGTELVLVARLHELARPVGTAAHLELRRWSLSHTHAVSDVELDFVERAGSRWWLYMASLLSPSTFLAREGPELEERLPDLFLDELAEGLARDLERLGDALLRADEQQTFRLDPRESRLRWTDRGQLEVELALDHLVGRTTNQPSAMGLAFDQERPRLRPLGQEEVNAAFRGASSTSTRARYVLRRTLTPPQGARFLRVHLRAGRAVSAVREYTLALPGARPSQPSSSPERP